jgi:hypothetical protein
MNDGASFVACVVLKDERYPSEKLYYHLCAIEPLEAEDDDGNIVAVGPGEMFTASGMELTPYLGIGIRVEVKNLEYTIRTVEPQYQQLVYEDGLNLPTLPPIDRVLT